MKTNARPLPATAAALFLAASTAIVTGCGNQKPDGAPPVVRGPNHVTVIVNYEKRTDTQTWYSSQGLPDKAVELSESGGDTVAWFPGGDAVKIEVVWDPKRPFDKDPEPDPNSKKILKSGPPSRGSSKHGAGKDCKSHANKDAQCYEYKAWLWLDADGKDKVKVDPRIVIHP
jgi:hypothetical protein